VKLNPLSSSSSLIRRSPQVAALGVLAFAVQIACSDAPAVPGPGFTAAGQTSTAGTTATAAGTGTVVPTAGSAGTFATTGGTFSTGGTGTAGDTTAAGTGGTGGDAAAGTATGGTGGTGVIVPTTPYCMGKTLSPLPYMVTDGFKQAGWDGTITQMKTGAQIVPAPAVDYCSQRVTGAVGDCSMWQWTPDPVTPAYSDVRWIRAFDAQFTHPNVCVADGAKYISFYARGAVGGEKITIGGCGIPTANEVPMVLTNKWAVYSVPLDGITYNTFDSGVENAFSWKAEPPSTQITFWIDNVQMRTDLPTIAGGGGTGGTGGSGGGGTGGGGTGGTGGT
jgi:hypothetical protein